MQCSGLLSQKKQQITKEYNGYKTYSKTFSLSYISILPSNTTIMQCGQRALLPDLSLFAAPAHSCYFHLWRIDPKFPRDPSHRRCPLRENLLLKGSFCPPLPRPKNRFKRRMETIAGLMTVHTAQSFFKGDTLKASSPKIPPSPK